jgi:hypothetical protein
MMLFSVIDKSYQTKADKQPTAEMAPFTLHLTPSGEAESEG